MFRMVRVPNIALMAMLAGLIAAAGLLLYMSPQASAQAPGPCTGLHPVPAAILRLRERPDHRTGRHAVRGGERLAA